MRLSQRLVWGAAAVVTAFALTALLLIDRRLEVRAVEETQRELLREVQGIAALSDAMADPVAVVKVRGAPGRRIAVLDSNGGVLADSDLSPAALARVASQRSLPDVAAALDSGRASTARYSLGGSDLLHATARTSFGAVRLSAPIPVRDDVIGGVRRDLFLAGLLAMCVALLLSTVFTARVTTPIRQLRDVTRALASGNTSQRAPISAPAEVGELSRAVHQLSETLAKRTGAHRSEELLTAALLNSLQEGVVAVDERRMVIRINAAACELLDVQSEPPFSADLLPRQRILREAIAGALAGRTTDNTEMELSNKLVILTARPLQQGGALVALYDITPVRRLETVRRDFVANVSHELRTPLTIIGGFAETLASDGDIPAEKQHEFAAVIRANALRMQRLVDDLLDLSRIESGGWTPKPAVLSTAEVIEEVCSQVQARAAAAGVTLSTHVTPGSEDVYADPTALRQILSNLVENALRHTPSGSVSLLATATDRYVTISVRDTGIGIAPEHLPRIFERFYRVDPGRSRDEGGTGLGLSIVRHLTEAHGGSVRAESTPRVGTTVSVSFPRQS